jgi:PTH1 family peptidyl-tRNA hydrolase
VLHEPGRDEANLIQDTIDQSVKLLPLLLEGNMDAAMLKLHTKPKG